jgi:hypothetical protein
VTSAFPIFIDLIPMGRAREFKLPQKEGRLERPFLTPLGVTTLLGVTSSNLSLGKRG